MAYAIDYDSRVNCVVTVFTNLIDAVQFGDELMESRALADATGTRLFLADFSKAVIDVDVFDMAATPDVFEAMGGEHPVGLALIPPESEKGREFAEFYKTVAGNRGWGVEIFPDRTSGENWLAALDQNIA